MKWLYVALVVAQSLDLSTTAVKLREGCREMVWPTQSVAIMGVGKGLAVGGTLLLRRRHPHLAASLAVAGIASGMMAGVHNMNTTCGGN